MPKRPDPDEVRMWIVDHVEAYPASIVRETAGRFHVSRQAVQRYVDAMVKDQILKSSGKTRGRKYALRPTAAVAFNTPVTGLQEDVLWSQQILPRLDGAAQNLVRICAYGFTEMLNNVIDHSRSESVFVRLVRTPTSIQI